MVLKQTSLRFPIATGEESNAMRMTKKMQVLETHREWLHAYCMILPLLQPINNDSFIFQREISIKMQGTMGSLDMLKTEDGRGRQKRFYLVTRFGK